MGFYVQDVWAIGEGIWRNTVGGFHVFDDHFSPVLVLLAPLGRIPDGRSSADHSGGWPLPAVCCPRFGSAPAMGGLLWGVWL